MWIRVLGLFGISLCISKIVVSGVVGCDRMLRSGHLVINILSISFLLSTNGTVDKAVPTVRRTFSGVSGTGVRALAAVPATKVVLKAILSNIFSGCLKGGGSILTNLVVTLINNIVPTFLPRC